MVRFLIIILLLSGLYSCGALKRIKRIDRVKESAELNIKSSSVSEDKSRLEDKSIKEEKVSERRSNKVTEEKEVLFDEKGSVLYVWEKKTSYGKENVDRETKDTMNIVRENESTGSVDIEAEFKSKIDSLKKDTHTDRTENSFFRFAGWGILIVFAAVAVVIFVRFRK